MFYFIRVMHSDSEDDRFIPTTRSFRINAKDIHEALARGAELLKDGEEIILIRLI